MQEQLFQKRCGQREGLKATTVSILLTLFCSMGLFLFHVSLTVEMETLVAMAKKIESPCKCMRKVGSKIHFVFVN